MQNRKLFIVSFMLFIGLGHLASAQEYSSDVWHKGQLVLLSGDTLVGSIKYNMETQAVEYSADAGKKLRAYSTRKLLAFEIYDTVIDSYRVFYILPFKANNDYEAPYIFELSYEGPHMSLLRTEKIETVTRSMAYMYATYTFEELQYTYYFIDRKARIHEFNGKKNDLLAILSDQGPEMRRFLRDENLKLDRLDHLVKICSYYNSLY